MNVHVCEWLRQPPPQGGPSEGVLTAARDEGVHLVIADRWHVPALAAELREAAVIEEIRGRELRAVLAALAGVRPVLLKGAALAHTHYARPELRPRSDTDLIIAESCRAAAAAALESLGYTRAPEVDGELAIGQFHFTKTDHHGVHHQLDVHWRVSNVRVFADALSYEELKRDAEPIAPLGPHAFGASAVHALLLACVHRVAHHDDTRHLLWLLDVHLLASRFTDNERRTFARLAVDRKMHAVCAKTLALSEAALGDLGQDWKRAMAIDRDANEPSRAFLGGQLRPAEILLSDVAATRSWTGRLRLLKEHLLPQASYIRARYPHWPAVLLPAAYAYRVIRGLPRWFRKSSYRASGG